jgi:hypothetical protein
MIGQSATVVLMVVLHGIPVQIALFLAAGILGGIVNVHFMTLMQTAAPAELQGRVQSLSTTLATAVMPLGMALAGVFYDLTRGDIVLVIGLPGLAMLGASAAALASREYRGFLASEEQDGADPAHGDQQRPTA